MANSPDASGARAPVEVAVGVLLRSDGAFLLASRPEGKPYAGYWEFPGGKIEPGETIAQALARELDEELGIAIEDALPWVTIEHVYPHAHVRLHFTRVTRWAGSMHAREGQRFGWFDLGAHKPEPLLPATIPCMRWLALPSTMGVTNAAELGIDQFVGRLESALGRGLRWVQLREPALGEPEFDRLFRATLALTRSHRASLVVNSMHPREYWHEAGGVHLRAVDLAALDTRPDLPLVGASTHARPDIDRAARLGLDYAVLGAVRETASHPGAEPIGWDGFAGIVEAPPLPVLAIGGLRGADLYTAMRHGAHGVAALRAAWE